MSLSWRGFRYQTGEIEDIVKKLRDEGLVEVDADTDEEVNEVIKDLGKMNIYQIEGLPYDYNARVLADEPEFLVRIGFSTRPVKAEDIDKDKILYIDFFRIEEPEKSYDEVFWG
ncbi:hypothetical protein [Petroclostridium sp. X23]|uniref:hypothetical protein n=1 Tax=Petroclostridium sp. X23 TaxID=3045146 RepID=UPI0024AE4239|nr:hypothetical protein [Petroclostridium sp. X23]WHH61399.1 hypothetical protein QKW49_12155 [Petroclostridium sp. X23]